jgi:uncharacterized protein with beta-barrel porin domain
MQAGRKTGASYGRLGSLFASTSLTAIIIAGGVPSAYAACNTSYINTTSPGCTNPTAITGIAINNSTITSGITNFGTISPNGIVLTNGSTVAGEIYDSGTINGGLSLDGTSKISSTGNAVSITGATFTGGITNGGTISGAGGSGVLIAGFSTFAGGITSTGKISGGSDGIEIFNNSGVATFSGGITTSGTISAGADGFQIVVSTFIGGISNNGTIAAPNEFGITLTVSNFSGGISLGSASKISADETGIRITGPATFTGGISNAGTITSTADDGINIAAISFANGITNSGTISGAQYGVYTSGDATFSGGIANSGTIIAAAVDAIDILGVTSFLGGINNSGQIFAGGNGIAVTGITQFGSSSAGGGISNSGTISAANYGIYALGVSTFMGGIANSGTITAHGSNAIYVYRDTTLLGGVTNSGTILAVNGNGIAIASVTQFGSSSAGGGITNSGTISAADDGIFVSTVATFIGGITNTGTISASHGIVITNTTGVSVFDSGTIIGTSGFAINFSTGPNTLTLGPGFDIQGKVIGSGTDTFQLGGTGSGNFDLATIGGGLQYEGFTAFNVVGGVWNTTGTFTPSATWNVNGGTLAGTGTFGWAGGTDIQVNAGGTLEPGTPGTPGTFMTLNGNLVFASGAAYLVNLNSTTASRANVAGSVTLNGAVEGYLAPGSYNTKTTYDILDPSSISGTFTGFTAINMPGFGGTLTYQANDVLLNLTAQLGAGGGLSPNQQNPANAINTYFNNGGTLPAGFSPLFGLSGAALGNALAQVSGEPATDAGKGANQLMNDFLDLMLDPTAGGGGGVNGGGAAGFAPEQDESLPADVALTYAKALKAPAAQNLPSSFDQRWAAWGSAYGGTSFTDGDAALGTNNVTASDYGFAAGMDYRATPNVTYGFGLTGGGTNWTLAQALGSGRSDAFGAGVYAKTHFGPAYLSGALAFANHWFTTDRIALGDQLRASFTGQSYAARLEGGYRYAVPITGAIVGVTPYAALQAQDFHTPSYSETDLTGGGLGLAYNSQNATDTRSELGSRFDNLQVVGGMPLILRGRLAWAHDWYTNATALNAAFQTLPGTSFTVNGAAPPKNSALTTAAAELHITSNWTAIAKFDGDFGSGSQTYGGTGTLRYSW